MIHETEPGFCRGQGARQEDASMFSQPGLYPAWAVQPLTVASAPARFAKCEMSASLLSNDQACFFITTLACMWSQHTCIEMYDVDMLASWAY